MAIALLGLGSNLGQPRAYLGKAIAALDEHVGRVLSKSSFIKTNPWGYEGSRPYLNAAVAVETQLTPWRLLLVTQDIERSLGRRRKTVDGVYRDRIIDIDILFYDDVVVDTYELTIPHRLIPERWFVLAPLLEIAPEWRHPTLQLTIKELALRYERNQNGT